MKKKLSIFALFVTVISVSLGFLFLNDGDPNADKSPVLNNEVTVGGLQDTTPVGFPFPTLFNFNYSAIPGVNGGTVGALLVNGRYYFNRWNSTTYYRYNNAGPNGGPGAIVDSGTYTGSTRDLAYDGRYIYAGKSTTQLGVLYRLDTGNMSQLTTFPIAGQDIRALAWDNNRKGFWMTGFSGNLFCKDSANVTKGTITSTLTGKYGMAWDSTLSQDSAWVWVWNQETSGTANTLNKYHAASGQLKATYTFNLPGASVGIAGGADVVVMPGTPPKLVLLLNYQNFALVGYRMKDVLVGLEHTNNGVRDFKLGQNYPNPFNPSTKIEFTLTKSGDVSLEVYDVNGKLVETLIDGYMNAGTKSLDFNASGLSSGTYFYKISANGYTETKKMLLVK
ncbi:MAG: T9SS type A sorting domain-containing protein [Ignavibacteria bacterium]|nr:T9SS type A sorting domain-containing protein [Ignavibacteria bacterium]